MSALDWSDGLMLFFLAVYVVAIWSHVSIGRSMFSRGEEYAPLSSSRWTPSETNGRQTLLLGMYWVAVPIWGVHVMSLALILLFEPRLIFVAGILAALSTASQAVVTFLVLGTGRAPGKVLMTHYVLQTIVALVWAFDHHCIGGVHR